MNRIVRFIFRFRILEIIFWLVQYYTLAHLIAQNGGPHSNYYSKTFLIVGFEILVVYFALFKLIPAFFNKNRYIIYFLSLLSSCIFAAIGVEVIGDIIGMIKGVRGFAFNRIATISHLVDIISIAFVFQIYHLGIYYFKKDQQNKLIQKQQLQDELNFLKAQLNPHFMFNVLNSIYILMKDDANKAREVLLQFSGLLRYQIYKNASVEVQLAEEFNFIQDYIALEKVREYDNLITTIYLQEAGHLYKIVPLVLITFVENAFKHISHFTDRNNEIIVRGELNEGWLNFYVSNTFEKTNNSLSDGIGIQNVKRRLELMYYEKHELSIKQSEFHHTVYLKIRLYEV